MVTLEEVRAVNDLAAFNRWAGIEVREVGEGEAVLTLAWREELGQYAGFLHAGVVAALLDTACGFAALTVAGQVLASHCGVSFLAPAVGALFVCRGTVVKAGRRQVFTRAELRAGDRLVATGETVLLRAEAAP